VTARKTARLLYEADGDFNPGWLIVVVFAALGALGCAVVFAVAYRDGAKASVMVASALGFCAFTIVTAATMVISLGRAKLLHGSKTLSSLARTMQGGGNVWTDDERDAAWDTDADGARAAGR
jgi:hypothetical protein